MSQKTNLNVSPYYDDFEKGNNFYRVLFKPGFPVQSRELTTLQSILQNQIESFGNHIFKDGSVVIPGNVTYNSEYYAVRINSTHVGLSVGLYLRNLVGKNIRSKFPINSSCSKRFTRHRIWGRNIHTICKVYYIRF